MHKKHRSSLSRRAKEAVYQHLDRWFCAWDSAQVRRTRNLRLIPGVNHRFGGKVSYAEWAHVVGIFQTLICQNLKQKEGNHFLDVGCGTGLLGIAAEPFIGKGGEYLGLDVARTHISFCQTHFPSDTHRFLHLDVENAAYAKGQNSEPIPWPVEDASQDMVTALSVWTHLKEDDALYYFREIERVLRPGGRALVTFFLLDELYEQSLADRGCEQGRFNATSQDKWIFDQPAYESTDWCCPEWVQVPEVAIGIKPEGFERMVSGTGLRVLQVNPGSWKEQPGLYFQDIVVFEKS